MKVRAEQWDERVRAWRASGQSAEAFCADKDFTAKMLRWWAGEFARRTRARRASKPSVALARVMRPGDEPPEMTDEPSVAVVVGRYQVAVRRGFDEELLRDVVRVLAEVR